MKYEVREVERYGQVGEIGIFKGKEKIETFEFGRSSLSAVPFNFTEQMNKAKKRADKLNETK